MKPQGIRKAGIYFRAYGSQRAAAYPAWRYHKIKPPILVKNTEEDERAREKGYSFIDAMVRTSPHLLNFMADFEDMTPRQLVLYAREEFQIDLPVEAGKHKLLQALVKLTFNSPKNKDRIILLAQSVRMNYDETVEEIKRLAKNGIEGFEEVEQEVINV